LPVKIVSNALKKPSQTLWKLEKFHPKTSSLFYDSPNKNLFALHGGLNIPKKVHFLENFGNDSCAQLNLSLKINQKLMSFLNSFNS